MSARKKIPWLTRSDVLAAHAEVGRLNFHDVKKAMGPNWPADWNRFGPGQAIFEPEAQHRSAKTQNGSDK